MPFIIVGCVLLFASPLIGAFSFHLREVQLAWTGMALSILPVALGIDLIWSGLRRSAI